MTTRRDHEVAMMAIELQVFRQKDSPSYLGNAIIHGSLSRVHETRHISVIPLLCIMFAAGIAPSDLAQELA
jgi:hypothetical protein